MTEFVTRAGIEADPQLAAFIETEVLGPLGRDADDFWTGFANLLGSFAPCVVLRLRLQSDGGEYLAVGGIRGSHAARG